MNCLNAHPAHISNILGHVIKNWTTVNPEALRAICKVNKENHDFLFMPSELKLKFIRDMKASNFKDSNGNTINLLCIEKEALQQKAALSSKTEVSEKISGKKAVQNALRDTRGRIHVDGHEVKDKPLGEVL